MCLISDRNRRCSFLPGPICSTEIRKGASFFSHSQPSLCLCLSGAKCLRTRAPPPWRARGAMSDPSGGGNEPSLAKTAGFLVFSGIAFSILKTLNPLGRNRTAGSSESPAEAARPTREAPPPPQPLAPPPCEPVIKRQAPVDQFVAPPEPLQPTVEIVKGDTLWGLSQKYGVSVDAIKEANGLTGNTIYAGRKLIIP